MTDMETAIIGSVVVALFSYAFGVWVGARTSKRVVRVTEYRGEMTPEQRAHFENAFAHADKAFDEMHKVFDR